MIASAIAVAQQTRLCTEGQQGGAGGPPSTCRAPCQRDGLPPPRPRRPAARRKSLIICHFSCVRATAESSPTNHHGARIAAFGLFVWLQPFQASGKSTRAHWRKEASQKISANGRGLEEPRAIEYQQEQCEGEWQGWWRQHRVSEKSRCYPQMDGHRLHPTQEDF
jgi:hypothetical protein